MHNTMMKTTFIQKTDPASLLQTYVTIIFSYKSNINKNRAEMCRRVKIEQVTSLNHKLRHRDRAA